MQLQSYLNSSHTSVSDLLQGGQRLMLLYPVDINLENQYYGQKNLHITDVLVSKVEVDLELLKLFIVFAALDRHLQLDTIWFGLLKFELTASVR